MKLNLIIYLKSSKGFGNKVFDYITAIYLKNKYNVEINYAIDKSVYDIENDPFFGQIFTKSMSIITFMFMNKYKKLEIELPIKEIMIDKLSDLPDISEYVDDVTNHVRFTGMHKFVYEMYSSFNKTDKALFTVNPKLISTKIEEISNTEYGCVHIRYGDKLCYANETYPSDKYPIYTPIYYKLQIKNLLSGNIDVIVMTDSIDLVNAYIMPEFTDTPKVRLLDSRYVESFYLLTKAAYIIMSYSTFSFAAAYINEMATCHLVKKPNTKDNFIYEDDDIDPNWVLIDEKRFILNYDHELLQKMAEPMIRCNESSANLGGLVG